PPGGRHPGRGRQSCRAGSRGGGEPRAGRRGRARRGLDRSGGSRPGGHRRVSQGPGEEGHPRRASHPPGSRDAVPGAVRRGLRGAASPRGGAARPLHHGGEVDRHLDEGAGRGARRSQNQVPGEDARARRARRLTGEWGSHQHARLHWDDNKKSPALRRMTMSDEKKNHGGPAPPTAADPELWQPLSAPTLAKILWCLGRRGDRIRFDTLCSWVVCCVTAEDCMVTFENYAQDAPHLAAAEFRDDSARRAEGLRFLVAVTLAPLVARQECVLTGDGPERTGTLEVAGSPELLEAMAG